MVFQKGQTGNPNGSRKPRIWADAINRAIQRRQDKDPRALEKLADKLLLKVDEGEIPAMKELADRLDGKAIQQIEVKNVNPFDDLTPEELELVQQSLTGQGKDCS